MDLHDYIDVAENYDYYINCLGADYSKFEDFYIDLAEMYGNDGIIDIACGTGALTLPLAQKGFDVTACDISDSMVEQTKRKFYDANVKADIFTGNMIDFEADRMFSLAIIARGGFMHLTSPQDQRNALLNIRAHLNKNGILTLNTFQPNPKMQSKQMDSSLDDYILRAEYINKSGKKELIYNSTTYDFKTQIMEGRWKFKVINEDGKVLEERIRPLTMRQTYKQELIYLCEICGFKVMEITVQPQVSNGLIWILQKVD